jgi:hypothetical protein
MQAILIAHAASTLMMTGLIWFVQVVHYPLFARVGGAEFTVYAALHQRLTTVIVGPLMLTEALTAGWLALRPPEGVGPALPIAGLGLVALLWLSTAFLQVPCHRRLSLGFDARAGRRLVRTNWLRTAAWTARSAIAMALLLPSGTTP